MNAKTSILQGISILAGATCGFLIGRAVFHDEPSSGGTGTADAVTFGVAIDSDRQALSPSDSAAIGAVYSGWQERNSLRRGWETQRAIDHLDAGQVAALVERVSARTDWEMEPLQMALLKHWVRVDPEAAAEWMRPVLNRQSAGVFSSTDVAILFTWCRADPEGALAFALEHPTAETSANMAWQAIGVIGEDEPTAGLERALALPEGNLRMSAVNGVISQWAKSDPAAALACLETLNIPDRWQVGSLSRIFKEWAEKDGSGALAEIARRMSPTATGRIWPMYRYPIETAAAADPAAALAVMETMPETMQNGFALTVLRGWAERDPVEALRWGQAHGLELNQAALFPVNGRSETSVLAQALTTDSVKTVAWLRTLPPGPERAHLLTSSLNFMTAETAREVFAELPAENQIFLAGDLGRQAAKLNTDEAITWSKSIDAAPVRSRVISEIVSNSSGNTVERLDAMVANYAPGLDRDAALRGATGAMVSEPKQAIMYASQISDSDLREQAFRRVAASWLYRDTAAAEAWLANTDELSPEVKALEIRKAAEPRRATDRPRR